MKKISIFIFVMIALVAGACSSYLDINNNPNQATSATANLILPQALVATASVLNQYNSYGAQIGGYSANAGGYGGFNENVSYKFTSANYNGLWSFTYDNLEDYQYIINTTDGDKVNIFYNAAATIMRAYDFQLLVDTYNEVPYSQALKGAGNLTPSYDQGSDIYKALAVTLDSAVARINRGLNSPVAASIAKYDVMFQGNMTSWLRLANSIKLRLIIRGGNKVTFDNTAFDPSGFLTGDAIVNPGYLRDNNRQNPYWNSWAWSYTGAAGNKAWMPTTWMMSFYNGLNQNQSIIDTARGKVCYYNFKRKSYGVYVFGDSISNQLGHEGTDVPACPTGSAWYSGTDRGGTTAGNTPGILKGPTAGVPIMLQTESDFLQAEAYVRGLSIPASGSNVDAASSFNNGMKNSYRYLYTKADGTMSGNYASDFSSYLTTNAGKYWVDFSAASSTDQQIEAIITQKYIALNYIHRHEGWNEYRRTGYPLVSGTGATSTFASTASQVNSARNDRLPGRIQYPVSESAYNGANIPTGVTVQSTIFWVQ